MTIEPPTGRRAGGLGSRPLWKGVAIAAGTMVAFLLLAQVSLPQMPWLLEEGAGVAVGTFLALAGLLFGGLWIAVAIRSGGSGVHGRRGRPSAHGVRMLWATVVLAALGASMTYVGFMALLAPAGRDEGRLAVFFILGILVTLGAVFNAVLALRALLLGPPGRAPAGVIAGRLGAGSVGALLAACIQTAALLITALLLAEAT